MDEKIGIIAGEGKLPELILEELNKRGKLIYSVILKGYGSSALKKFSTVSKEYKIGEVGKILKFFKSNGIKSIIMAGKVEHVNIFRDLGADAKAFGLLKRLKEKNTLSIYSIIKDFLEENHINLLDYNEILKEHIPQKGVLSGKLKKELEEDLKRGFGIAKKIAELDVGQSIAYKDGVVVGVEAIEGTDAMIERVGNLTDNFFLIKVSNPHQSMSFDMPVIGINTLEKVFKAKGRGVVIEASKTIVLDLKECIEYAKRQKIILVAL